MDPKSSARHRRAELVRLSGPALREALVERLQAAAASALGLRPGDIRVDFVNPDPLPLFVLLEAQAVQELGFPFRLHDLPHCHSIATLAEHLAGELPLPPVPSAPMGDLYEGGTEVSEVTQRRFDVVLDRPIVFLLSAPRSGSTLLCSMLSRHPKLYGASELSLLPFESMGARGRQLDSGRHSWMRIGLFSAIRDLTGMTDEQATQEYARLEQLDVAVSAIYARLQELAGDRILVDKSPMYAMRPQSLGYAERLFRSARYIHLTRHPGAVIESFVRMRFHLLLGQSGLVWDDNPWIFGEKVWTSANLHVLRFLQGVDPSRQLRVSYESLVADPAGVIARICDFLGIPFDPGPLQPYAGLDAYPKDFRAGDPGFFTHSAIEAELASEWRRSLPPHPFGGITQEVAAALGYSVR